MSEKTLEHIILIAAVFIVIRVSLWIAKKREKDPYRDRHFVSHDEPAYPDDAGNAPVGFGYKCAWFAVKSKDPEAVAQVLGFKHAQVSGWQSGIKAAYSKGVFVTPPVNGWVLAAGQVLLFQDADEGLQKIKVLANKLSTQFGEAQFFATHRVVEYHCWLKSVKGEIQRVYAYVGEQGENIEVYGAPTAAESKNLVNTLSAQAQDEGYLDREDLVYPNEEMVMEIAAAWSVNPTTIEENQNIEGRGLLEQIAEAFI